jgi:Zn-dependent protease
MGPDDQPPYDRPWQVPSQWDAEPVHRRIPIRPSPIFLALVAIFVAAGVYVWTRNDVITYAGRVGIFVFVAVGWIITLSLHEFDHAAVAWWAGDHSVEERGYLTLDPRRYMNGQLSIVLPILIVLIGGLPLPGGAVMIDRRFMPSKVKRSLVSAAGPLTNAACAVALGLPLKLHWIGSQHEMFREALAFFAFLQVVVTVLNSLPLPGLDGFGVLAPWLPDETVRSLMPISNYVFMGLFLVLLTQARASSAFFDFCFREAAHLGVPRALAQNGSALFIFYRHL